LSLIKLIKIEKIYGPKKVLDELNLEIEEGELLVVLGPSGHGKTKLLEIIAALETPNKGKIFWQDKQINHWSPLQRNIGMVFQDYALFPHLTVKENILFGLKVRQLPSYEIQLKEMLSLLNLEDLVNLYPHQLSGGQQQRTALARALIIRPHLLLLDEPFSALDAQLRHYLRIELRNLQKKLGITTVFVTHDQTEAYTLGDRIAILYQGKIVQTGKPEEIFSQPQNKTIAKFLGLENIYQGKVLQKTNCQTVAINLGQWTFLANTKKQWEEKNCFFWIKPDEITLSSNKPALKAENSLVGKIKNIISLPSLSKIYLEIGGDLQDLVINSSPKFLEKEKLKFGSLVHISFSKQSIYLFHEEGGLRK